MISGDAAPSAGVDGSYRCVTEFQPRCASCGPTTIGPDGARCGGCAGTIRFEYDVPLARVARGSRLWSFSDWLPVREPENRVTLNEGGTPLLPARGDYGCQVWFKDESRNPTGSQKDRALALAVSAARERGLSTLILASAGSTGLAAAAYAARAGLRAVVIVPRGTPVTRIQPLLLYGAHVLEFFGPIDRALELLAELRPSGLAMEVSTIRSANPFQAEAPKTIAFEVHAELVEQPDWMVIPTGGGGTLAGVARGFADLEQAGLVRRQPRLVAVQPTAYNTLERALPSGCEGQDDLLGFAVATEPFTVLNKLAHSFPPDGREALDALRATHGVAISVTDATALAEQAYLAHTEGLFVEPSAAAGVAGLRQLVAAGTVLRDDRVVICLTGGGFRELSAIVPSTDSGDVTEVPPSRPLDWLTGYLAGLAGR